MTVAKALSSGYAPIAAAIMRDSVFEIFKEKSEVPFGHLLTFGGHPVAAAAAAIKNLEIYDDENLVDKGAEHGRVSRQAARGVAFAPDRGRRPRRRHALGHRSGQEQEGTGPAGAGSRHHSQPYQD